MTAPSLPSSERAHLRGRGQRLKPTVFIGREGPSDGVIRKLEEELMAHELVKIRVLPGEGLRETGVVAEILAEATGASFVQVIGHNALLYRERPDEDSDTDET